MKFLTLEQRKNNCKEILILSLPKDYKEEDVKKFICDYSGLKKEEIFDDNCMISLLPDNRPE